MEAEIQRNACSITIRLIYDYIESLVNHIDSASVGKVRIRLILGNDNISLCLRLREKALAFAVVVRNVCKVPCNCIVITCLLKFDSDVIQTIASAISIDTGIRHEVTAFAPERYGTVVHIGMPCVSRIPVILEDKHGRLCIPTVSEDVITTVRETDHSRSRFCSFRAVSSHPLEFRIIRKHYRVVSHIPQKNVLCLGKAIVETLPSVVRPYDVHHEPAGIVKLALEA